jgi:hypothetical protein
VGFLSGFLLMFMIPCSVERYDGLSWLFGLYLLLG